MAAAMTERLVSVEFVFDRVAEQTLAQAYRILVPERRARTSQTKDSDDEPSQGSVADCDERPALGA
jgi:hypothetical protein